jgi:hypothetical protein
MNDNHSKSKPRRRLVTFIALGIVLAILGTIGYGIFWYQTRVAAHQGLEGTWVDNSGQDVSYQFDRFGTFRIRQRLPGTMAPFTGDPGIDHKPRGTWTRSGNRVTIKAEPNFGFELTLDEDGVMRGKTVFDHWTPQGQHFQSESPIEFSKK